MRAAFVILTACILCLAETGLSSDMQLPDVLPVS
jgi:hypothetical protein